MCDLQAHIEALETTTTQLQALVGASYQTATPRPTTPVSTATPANEPLVTLSTLIDTYTVVVDTDRPAHCQVRSGPDMIRVEVFEPGERTVEAVIDGSAAAMTALADRLYAAAEAATDRGEVDA